MSAVADIDPDTITGAADSPEPRIWLCWAQSLDGAITQDKRGRTPTNLTHDSVAAERLVHTLRARADAIVVGVGTVCSDNPRLTVRLPDDTMPGTIQPGLVVLDPTLRCPPTARIFEAVRTVRLVTTALHWRCDPGIQERARVLQAWTTGRAVIHVVPIETESIPLDALVQSLARPEAGMWRRLHVEGGARVLAEWAAVAHVQVTLIAPVMLGAAALRVPWLPQPTSAAGRTPKCHQWYVLDVNIVCLVVVR